MARTRIPLLALSIALLASCGSSDEPSDPNPPPPAATANDITIVVGASQLTTGAFTPNPKVVSLAGGSSVTVRWVNKDIAGDDYATGTATRHTIASDEDAFTTSSLIGGNGTYSVALTEAGDYGYHCTVHPNMVGTVTVNP
jgi:plastocyanin